LLRCCNFASTWDGEEIMEKNGAISSNTPGCGRDCGCASKNKINGNLSKSAQTLLSTPVQWPTDKEAADSMEGSDALMRATDAVKDASKLS
jgi:hypothetical protein